MDHIVTLDSRQEAALQAIADKFIAQHKGDPVKALKEMIVLNGHTFRTALTRSLLPAALDARRNDKWASCT
ncbi:hypothetical protein [Mesorhizobium sp. M1378]|uniref:hypothetical protein n=1 Tax=Mesorhizobium sp. M1378 TaxID=2957092 RepID=UPI00333B8E76